MRSVFVSTSLLLLTANVPSVMAQEGFSGFAPQQATVRGTIHPWPDAYMVKPFRYSVPAVHFLRKAPEHRVRLVAILLPKHVDRIYALRMVTHYKAKRRTHT